MYFETNKTDLLAAIKLAKTAIDKKSNAPTLTKLHLHSTPAGLLVYGSSQDNELLATVPGTHAPTDHNLLDVAAAQFEKAVQHYDEEALTLSINENLKLAIGDSFALPLTNIHTADSIQQAPGDVQASLTVEANDLRRMLLSTAYSMANQDVRYYLNGMLWELTADRIKCVATDGHRLAINHISASHSILAVEMKPVILRRETILAIMAVLGKKENDIKTVQIEVSARAIQIKLGAYTVSASLVDGKYPEWRAAVSFLDSPCATFKMDHTALSKALSKVEPFANPKYKGMRLTLPENDGLVVIHVNNPEGAEATAKLTAAVEDNSNPIGIHPNAGTERKIEEIGFNLAYVKEVLSKLDKTKPVTLSLSGPSTSGSLTNGDGATHIVMPARL